MDQGWQDVCADRAGRGGDDHKHFCAMSSAGKMRLL